MPDVLARTYLVDHIETRERPLSKRYVEELASAVTRLEQWRGRPLRISQLNAKLIDDWIESLLAEGRAQGTVNWLRSALVTLWRSAHAAGVNKHEPHPITRKRKEKPFDFNRRPAQVEGVRSVITKRVRRQLVQAAQLIAQGRTHEDAAAKLGVQAHCIRDWQVRHPVLWEFALANAMEVVRDMVRRLAGTKAMLKDPGGYMEAAEACARWARARGEQLFPRSNELTLVGFFEEQYLPIFLGCAKPETVRMYRVALNRWELMTGNPPLAQIDNVVLATFRDAIGKLPGRKGEPLSPNTVRMHLRHIQALLDKAGPPSFDNRGALGLIPSAPWVKFPRELRRMPRVIASETLDAVYLAAEKMTVPELPFASPAQWWQALLVTAYNTGLRIGTLRRLPLSAIRWSDGLLEIQPESLKSGIGHVIPLNPTAMDHLRRFASDRELIFPWPFTKEYLRTCFHELQDAAGIPAAEHFGFHNIRKTTATVLYGFSPQAAQLTLGHTTLDMTIKHYVYSQNIMSQALNAMPQPAAFQRRAGGGA